jgi:hypothetical protein
MLNILGENYYFNLDKINDYLNVENPQSDISGSTEQHISVIRYEMVKMMIEVILTENDDADEMLGSRGSANLTIPFKMAFNTLLKHQMIQSI